MAARRAPYLYQIRPFVEEGKLRSTRDRFALEVREPIQVVVVWQYKGKTLQQEWKAEPGQVLRPAWRDTSPWERELFEQKRGEWDILQIAEANGRIRVQMVQIVELFDDLPAAIRQTLRHIPSRLIGRTVRVKGEEVRVAGEVQEVGTLVQILGQLTQRFATRIKISPQLAETALREIASIREILARMRAPLKVRAREELEGATVAEAPVAAAKASVALLERRAQDLKMAEMVLQRANRWLRIMRKIESGLSVAYKSLGRLIRELEPFVLKGEAPEPKVLLRMGREAENLLAFLRRVGSFNPYYGWVHSPPVERLGRAVAYAEAGKAKTLFSALKGALARIEKGVIGEKPEPEELAKIRRRI